MTATLGLVFEVQDRGLQQAADKGVEATRRVGEQAKKSNEDAKRSAEQAAKAAQQYTDQLKRQADTLGMSRTQVMAYEAAQHKLTDAQRQSAQQAITSIDAYDRKQVALGRLQTMARAAGAALGVALVVGAKASVTASAQAEQSQLRLEAVLKATKYTAGLTGQELERMSGDMQSRLGINDEAVKDSMAVLLTFRQVGRESFGDAMEVAANLAAVMGTDLKSATMQLGKALENPEQGLTALTRSGISFSAAQKEAIKDMAETGRQGEAITMILRIMKDQGLDKVAESMNQGLTGAARNLNNTWGDLLETIGKTSGMESGLASVFGSLTGYLKDMKTVIESGDWLDKLAFFTVGYTTSDVKRAQTAKPADAFTGSERAYVRQADQNKAQRVAGEQASEYLKQFRSDNQKLEDELKKWNRLADSAGMSTEKRAEGEAAIRGKFAKKGSDGAKQGASMITQLQDELAKLNGEGNEYDALVRKLTDGTVKLTAAQLAEVLALKGEIVERKRAKEATEAYLKTEEYHAEIMDEIEALKLKQSQASASANKQISDSIEAVQLETQLMGLSNTEREKKIALLELEKQKVNLTTFEYERYREQIEAAYNNKGRAEAQKKALEDQQAEQKRFNDDLARGLTDSIFRGFEGGKSFAKNFWDSMKNMAKTTVLQPVVKFIISPVTNAIGSVLGGMGIPGMGNAATGASSGGSGLGSLGSLFSGGNPMGWVMNAGGIAGSAGAYASALGLGSSAAGSQAAMLAAQTAEFGVAGLASTASSAGAGAMSGLISAAPYAAAALAAYSLLKSKKTPAVLTGKDLPAGMVSYGGGLSGTMYGNDANQGYRWAGEEWSGYFKEEIRQTYDAIERAANALGYDGSRVRGITATVSTGSFMDARAEALPQVLAQLTSQLASQVIPNLATFARAGETAAQTLGRLTAEAQQASLGRMQAALGLADNTRDLWLSDLSPLSPESRLKEAGLRYSETLGLARGGDANAIAGLSGMSRSYLEQARGYYASGTGYADIFSNVQGDLRGLVNDTLVEQSIAFANISGSLTDVAASLNGLDKRIASQLEAALKAREITDDAWRKATLQQNAELITQVRDLTQQLARVAT